MKTSEEEMINKVLMHGKRYDLSPVPPELEKYKGEPGDCFDTSMWACMYNTKLRYVEGVAFHLELGKFVFHAWVTDGTKHYDLTWKAVHKETKKEFPVPSIYIGIEIELKALLKFVQATEYKCVLSNWWRNKPLAEKALKFNL